MTRNYLTENKTLLIKNRKTEALNALKNNILLIRVIILRNVRKIFSSLKTRLTVLKMIWYRILLNSQTKMLLILHKLLLLLLKTMVIILANPYCTVPRMLIWENLIKIYMKKENSFRHSPFYKLEFIPGTCLDL